MRVESHVGAVGTWHTKTHMGKEQRGMHAWAAWALGGVCHHPAGGEKRGRERIPSPHIMQGEDMKEGKQMCRCNTILGPGHDPGYRPQTNRGGWTGQTWDGMPARRKEDIIIPLIRDLIRIISSPSSSMQVYSKRRGQGEGTRD